MFTIRNSQRTLARVVAGLAITATFTLGAIAHTVLVSQPLV
jgi:hypothetical protein